MAGNNLQISWGVVALGQRRRHIGWSASAAPFSRAADCGCTSGPAAGGEQEPYKKSSWGGEDMNSPNKILYEHLKDYPPSTEGYNEINNRAVAAALCCEHMPEISEASPEAHKPAVRDSSG